MAAVVGPILNHVESLTTSKVVTNGMKISVVDLSPVVLQVLLLDLCLNPHSPYCLVQSSDKITCQFIDSF